MLDGFKSDVLYLYSKFNLEIFIMKITNPKLEVVRFNADDVIATSLYWTTSEAYEAATGVHYDTPYVWFNGDMSATDNSGEYRIDNIYAVEGITEDSLLFVRGGYIPDAGITFPGTKSAYQPYYKDGDWYTNGVTYKESIGQ